jgi:hypothetical protein
MAERGWGRGGRGGKKDVFVVFLPIPHLTTPVAAVKIFVAFPPFSVFFIQLCR